MKIMNPQAGTRINRSAPKTLAVVLWVLSGLPAHAQYATRSQPTVTLLYTFRTSGTPTAFVEVNPGLFWGVAATGGQIFSITASGRYNTVYTFPPVPSGITILGLTAALNGYLYGGYSSSGTTQIADLFASTLKGLVTLHAYNGATQGGPNYVVQYPDDNLYTFFGVTGSTTNTFTRLDYGGKTTDLYTLTPAQGVPRAPFIGIDGNFYGISLMGNTAQLGIYRLMTSGAFSWVVPSMPTGKFGVNHGIALMQATNGKFFGTLPQGGAANAGTIYEANLDGNYKTIYQFDNLQFGIPETLIQASDGMLYGTARGEFGGGYTGYSSVFRVNPSTGQFKTIYNFTNALIGECECILTQGTDGKLYGADFNAGTYVGGTIFVMDLGLPKPLPHVANIIPRIGSAGQSILLFGDGFLGATAVSFNGTPATTLIVPSHQGIRATVPSGATTGPITVTTPNGSFTTKISFTVQ